MGLFSYSIRSTILFVILFIMFSKMSYPQKIVFDDKSVVKILNYQNVELVQVSGNNYYAIPVAGHGSGVMVDSSGIILTNAHVVENARALAVIIPGNDLIFPAEVVYRKYEPENGIDFAFLMIEGKFKNYLEIKYEPEQLIQLEDVFAWGYPMDFANKNPAAVRGIISRYDEQIKLWQMDAQINPGNSGGPVINRKGNLLGISVSKRNNADGMNYFMSLEKIAKSYLELKNSSQFNDVSNLMKYQDPNSKIIKKELLEILVQMNLNKKLSNEMLKNFEKTLSRLSYSDSSNSSYQLADYAAIASSVFYNLYISSSQDKNLKYLNDGERKQIIQLLNDALLYAGLAMEIDPCPFR